MADSTIGTDDPLEQFNAEVEAEQEAAKRRAAERLAIETGLGPQDAYALLAACQWSVTRARRLLAKKAGG